jgi:hypothetical protein
MIERRIAQRAYPLADGFQKAGVVATGIETAIAGSVVKPLEEHC